MVALRQDHGRTWQDHASDCLPICRPVLHPAIPGPVMNPPGVSNCLILRPAGAQCALLGAPTVFAMFAMLYHCISCGFWCCR